MKRFEGWEGRLARLVEQRRHAPFAWATNDCASFAADAVIALTAADPLAPWRGTYGDEAAATAHMAGGLMAMLERQIGRPRQQVDAARRGDILLMPYDVQRHGLAVCLGRIAAAPGDTGLVFNPTRAARVFWPIGWELL